MYQTYSNGLYSNVSESSRRGGGSWVCINGELYHFGRPGMKWGKHLPGTDWWKETMERNKANNGGNAINALWRTGKMAFNINKGKVKDAVGYEFGSAKKRIGNKYANAIDSRNIFNRNIRKNANVNYQKNQYEFDQNYSNKSLTHLETYMAKQLRDGKEMAERLKSNRNSGMAALNLSIQNAQYNVIKGVNSFLNKFGLSDKVDRFLSKFLGDSESIKKKFTVDMGSSKRNNYEVDPKAVAKAQAAVIGKNQRNNYEADPKALERAKALATSINQINQLGKQKRQDEANVYDQMRKRIRNNSKRNYAKSRNATLI